MYCIIWIDINRSLSMKGMPIYCIMQVISYIDGDDKDDDNDNHQHLLKTYYLPGSLMIYIHYVFKTSLQ